MRILTVLLLSAAMAACNTNAKKDAGNVGSKPEKESASESGSKIVRNDISFKATGITVHQAFLTLEDGSLVPDNNKMQIGRRVILHLIIDGWKTDANEKVMLGAAEKITTSTGQVILDQDNLFDSYQDGVSLADARIITLSAVITRADKQFKYFEVAFRVWDKTSGDNVTGSYKLYP
jgi:hypothetical protein